jgi:large subunit ribosomal protein L30
MKRLKVTLAKSLIDQKEPLKRTVRALGLRRMGASRVHDDSQVVQGMIFKVKHLLKVEEV